jgi:3-oxoacyl-[acyl-carrier protein] reductase
LKGNITMEKTALVTGAGRGIGRAIAIALAENGMNVVVNYNGSADKAEETAEIIRGMGVKAVAYKCNVADFEECKKMIDDVIAEFGRIDVLVNNAGITRDNLLMKMSEDDFDSVIGINLKGAFNTTKHVSKYLLKQKAGKIINISSVSGILGNPGQANYSASKAGVIGLTKSTARELASRGITCNAIAPGFIETDMTSAMNEQVIEKSVEMIPLKRIGKAEEIAHMAAFLASEKADYITGQVFAVDGGMTI